MRQFIAAIVLTFLLAAPHDAAAYRWRASTPESEAMHGMAHIIRNQGRAARNYSRANINNEEARSKFIDNQRKWTQVYFEKKEMLASYKSRTSARQRESREKYLATNPSAPPPRMSASQLDRTTGEISWPTGLQLSQFDSQRQNLESLFAVRTRATTTTVATDIRTAVDAMRTTLKTQIKSMAPDEYMAARKFLDSMSYEATQPNR
jgi:hypothetical protein